MTAKEMFEKLGYYKYDINVDDLLIGWQRYDGKSRYYNIHFYVNKKIRICGAHITEAFAVFVDDLLSVEELQAITQQMKELGWIE